MKKVIFGVLVLMVFVVSGCDLLEENPQLSSEGKLAVMRLPGGGGGGSGTTCTDTDGGIHLYEKGTVVLGGESKTDYCLVQGGVFMTLNEYYCDGLNIVASNEFCPYGCQDGICNGDSTILSCSDSDGGINYDEKGTVTAGSAAVGEFTKTDFCDSTGSNLFEWYCELGEFNESSFGWEYTNCANGCYDGVCSGPMTYQGILDMLENSEIHLAWGEFSCSDICSTNYGKTCITAAQHIDNTDAYEAVPCNYVDPINGSSRICRCASP